MASSEGKGPPSLRVSAASSRAPLRRCGPASSPAATLLCSSRRDLLFGTSHACFRGESASWGLVVGFRFEVGDRGSSEAEGGG